MGNPSNKNGGAGKTAVSVTRGRSAKHVSTSNAEAHAMNVLTQPIPRKQNGAMAATNTDGVVPPSNTLKAAPVTVTVPVAEAVVPVSIANPTLPVSIANPTLPVSVAQVVGGHAVQLVNPTGSVIKQFIKDEKPSYNGTGTPTPKVVTPSSKAWGSVLQGLGMSPSTHTKSGKDSRLKVVIIRGSGPLRNTIVLRVEPYDPNSVSSWAEKCCYDCAIHKNGHNPDWVRQLGLEQIVLNWFHKNIAMKNSKNYAIRLFQICVEHIPTPAQMLSLGKIFCRKLNDEEQNTTTTTVDPDNFYWLPSPVVWSQVIGYDQAVREMYKLLGDPKQGYFEEYKDVIYCFFPPQSFSVEFANSLDAPMSEVHYSVRPVPALTSAQVAPADQVVEAPAEADIKLALAPAFEIEADSALEGNVDADGNLVLNMADTDDEQTDQI